MFGFSLFSHKPVERKLPVVQSPSSSLNQLLDGNYHEAFDEQIRTKDLSKEEIVELAQRAVAKINIQAISILARYHPHLVNAETVSTMLPTDGDRRDAFTYSLLEANATGELSQALQAMCSAQPKEGVSTVFAADDKHSITAYIAEVRRQGIRTGNFLIREGGKYDSSTAVFKVEGGKFKADNSTAELLSKQVVNNDDVDFTLRFPGFL